MIVDESAVMKGIDHEPFNGLVRHVLKKRDRIFALVEMQQPRYFKQYRIPKDRGEVACLQSQE